MRPGPTLQAAISRSIESALNRSLALDPAGREALLTALSGPVQFSVTAPAALTLTLQRSGDQVRVGSTRLDNPALELSGSAMAFAALAMNDQRVFSDQRFRVEGDSGLAHQFQRALDRLSPDWEAALAEVIGDVPAHFIGQRLRSAVSWSRAASAALQANLDEYLHEESRTLPGRHELEATFEDIDALSLQTERLAARIERLRAGPRRARTDDTDSPEQP